MTRARQRSRRTRLWEARGGLCHWCGIKTFLPKPGHRGRQHPQQATIDHLDDRLSGRRGQFSGTGAERTVLSCYRCNQLRSRESVAQHAGRLELWRHA